MFLTSNSDFSISNSGCFKPISAFKKSNLYPEFDMSNQTYSNQIQNFYKTMHILHINYSFLPENIS